RLHYIVSVPKRLKRFHGGGEFHFIPCSCYRRPHGRSRSGWSFVLTQTRRYFIVLRGPRASRQRGTGIFYVLLTHTSRCLSLRHLGLKAQPLRASSRKAPAAQL